MPRANEFPDDEDYTVEDLNPRGSMLKSLEMAVRRGIALERVCRWHHAKLDRVAVLSRGINPVTWGSMNKRRHGYNPHTDLDFIGMKPGTWEQHFDAWYSGSLIRQIRQMAELLPDESRKVIDSELDTLAGGGSLKA